MAFKSSHSSRMVDLQRSRMRTVEARARTYRIAMAWTGACCLVLSIAIFATRGSSQTLQGPSTPPRSVGAWQTPTRNLAVQSTAAPTPRDCHKLVTQANPGYAMEWKHWPTNGSGDDIGQVLNSMGVATHALQADLGDLQVRIEQLRCENQNLSDKLDYIIRKLPQ
jgi:hypothetical protein